MSNTQSINHGIVFTLVALVMLLLACICRGDFGLIISLIMLTPIPGIALILFAYCKEAKHEAWAIILSFCPMTTLFIKAAPEMAASDAQGAIIYVFGPIWISLICLAAAAVTALVWRICRALRPD